MALYVYQAFSRDGKKVRGTFDAASAQQVKEHLARQGLFPISIAPGTLESALPWWRRLFVSKVSVKDKILFTKQFAILLRSGVPLLQALELLVEQLEGNLRTIIVNIKDEIKEGRSLADALKKYPKTFDNIYIQLVRAGEASGNLEVILERLTSYMERQEVIRGKVSSALRGPMMQMIFAVIVVVILLVSVVPSMAENFADLGGELPAPTRFLMAISDFVTSYYLLIAAFLGAAFVGFKFWVATPAGARAFDKFKLRLPIISYFARTNAVVQFSYTLGMLLEGGVDIAEALDIVCSIIDNRILADALSQARDKIIKQGKITQYLKQADIFPPIAIYLIKTGEETGKLDVMLLTVARNYEEDLGEYADNLSALIGPISLVVMAVVVGFIVISIMLPIVSMGGLAG